MERDSSIHLALPWILTVLWIIAIVSVVLFLNKGFDVTDEGGFLLSYERADIYRGGVYNYHLIINKTLGWANLSILGYRVVGVLLTLVSTLIFNWGFCKWYYIVFDKEKVLSGWIIVPFLSLGVSLFEFTGIRTINNNTLTNFLLISILSLTLYAASVLKANQSKRINLPFIFSVIGIGFCVAFSFFVKFSAGSLLLITVLGFLLYSFRIEALPIRSRLYGILALGGGVIGGMLLYWSGVQSYEEWIRNFNFEYRILSDHSPVILLERYFSNVVHAIWYFLKYFSWLLVGYVLYRYRKQLYSKIKIAKVPRWTEILVFVVAFTIQLILMYRHGYFKSTFVNGWTNAYLFLCIMFFQGFLRSAYCLGPGRAAASLDIINVSKYVHIIVFLFIAPFIVSVGTANNIFLNSLWHSSPWFALIVINNKVLLANYRKGSILLIFMLLPGISASMQVMDGNVNNPYYKIFSGNKAGPNYQNYSVSGISRLEGIYVDIESARFLRKINLCYNEIRDAATPQLLGYHIPGIVYLLGAISPVVPYYFRADRDVKAINKWIDSGQPLYILESSMLPLSRELRAALDNKGVKFPNNYYLAKRFHSPYQHGDIMLYIPCRSQY